MVEKIETPREFYANVVEIDVIEFRDKSDDLRLAYHACVSLLSLRDWIFEKYNGRPWTWMGNSQQPLASKGTFQANIERLHDDFRIITDVANASSQPPTAVTADSVIIDDGGKLYDVRTSVESTNTIWRQLLKENNW
jgi:hypothetical protein